jgi:hypothetical protein
MKQYTVEEALELGNQITVKTSILITALVTFAVVVVLVKLLWSWTIPDLFPIAVEQSLIAEHISWFTAFKLAIFVALVTSAGALLMGKWGHWQD